MPGPSATPEADSARCVWHPDYEVDIGPHVFPTRKYRLIRDRLVAEGLLDPDRILRPQPVEDWQVALAHDAGYLTKLRGDGLSAAEERTLEVPFSVGLRDAMWLAAGGSLAAARQARHLGAAIHLGGGFHHAFPDHGEGFCLINDVAIALCSLLDEQAIERAVVIDLDVHHGNGTAATFARDERVFTFSMHQQNNYPFFKPAGDLDIGLADCTDDANYLAQLERALPQIIDDHRPELAFYLAGADPYAEDQLGGLALTIDGLAQRDRFVLDLLAERRVPVAVTLAGGYARNTDDTVEIHCNTARQVLG